MKQYIIIVLLSFASFTVSAQKIIEKSIDYNNQFIEVEVKFASKIEVKTWDKSTVYFKADLQNEFGKFMDLYKLDIDENATNITIRSEAENVFKAAQKDCRKNNPDDKYGCYNTGDLYEFTYVLYVPKNAKFKVSSINGDLKSERIEGDFQADLINGDIDIAKYSGRLDLNTINGAIDLKMINAELKAETIHGDIYADEKLNFTAYERHVGQKISGSVGNGKNKLLLNTINGNMYLRN